MVRANDKLRATRLKAPELRQRRCGGRATPCPTAHLAAIEFPEPNNDLSKILQGVRKTCVISTPCCAFAISMPR
jgi:hypothetical protein